MAIAKSSCDWLASPQSRSEPTKHRLSPKIAHFLQREASIFCGLKATVALAGENIGGAGQPKIERYNYG